MQGLSFHRCKAKLFQKKRNNIPKNGGAKPSRKRSQIVSRKETTPHEMQGLSLHGSEAKLSKKQDSKKCKS
jgi:hypothetical protein